MKFPGYAGALLGGLLLLLSVSAASGEDAHCDAVIIDVATKGLRMEAADPVDIYVAARQPTEASPGSIFSVYRPKNVREEPSSNHLLQIYIGRLQIIDVQNGVFIGRMIESASPQEYPRVRYETAMIGDCLRLEPAEEVVEAGPAVEEPVAQRVQGPPSSEYTVETEAPVSRRVIPTKILFKFDSAEIEEKWYSELEHLAEFIAEQNPTRVVVEGHACSIGPEDYNLKLSERRAQAVIDHLSAIHGLPKELFEIKAYGESRPEVSNETREGRKHNRRAVTLILYQAVPTTKATADVPADWPVVVEPPVTKPVRIVPSEPPIPRPSPPLP